MKTGRTKKRTKNSNRNFFQNDNLISVKPASMFGTPVQNDDKKAGQRIKKKIDMPAAQSLIFLLHWVTVNRKQARIARRAPQGAKQARIARRAPQGVVRELTQQRRRQLQKRHLKSEVALLQTLSRLYSTSFILSNVGNFYWSWILKDCIKVLGKKKEVVVLCSRPPQSLFSRCSRAVTSKKSVYKKSWCTCRVVVLTI